MAKVNITINGQEITTEAGRSILEAAREAGIDIPTLCDHPALQPIGACRMCLVEIAGQRGLQPACTSQVVEGMEVQTESSAVVEARKFILQLLFAERNHFCMYCQMSGNCELQDLAYRYGLDHWTYERAYPKLEVDSSHPYFILDHNRCVLCQRCVRACDEIAGNHTLGVRERGINSMICADLNVPLGESSCISCGTCVQVCPTGALLDRKSAYLDIPGEADRVKSTCTFCSIGCGVELVTCYNNLVRIDGDWDAPTNSGLLCEKGRYEPLYNSRTRVRTPMIQRNGTLEKAEWNEALQLVADKLQQLKGESIALVSPRLTNEALALFTQLFRQGLQMNVGSLIKVPEFLSGPEGDLSKVDQADFIVVTGDDLTVEHQVVGLFVKRAVTNRGARLVLIGEGEDGLAPYASYQLSPSESARAIALCTSASAPVIIYGPASGPELQQLRRALAGKAHFLGLVPGANSRGALAVGINGMGRLEEAKGAYILSADDQIHEDLLEGLAGVEFIAVQSSYFTPLTQRADVVLPAAIWSEKAGHFTNTEGRILEVAKAKEPPPGIRDDEEVLRALAEKLSISL